MLAVADQVEIDHIFPSCSISDQDSLQAIEILESAQTSADQAAQISTVKSAGNAGTAGAVEPLQLGKFYTDCTFTICIPAYPVDNGRKPASPADGSR